MTNAPKRAKFTKGYVDKVRPAAKDDFHWDTDVKGFGLRITPTGKITFIVQGRVEGSGKEARITIGAYGVFTVDQARDMAREHLRTMRKGGDPRANKKQDEAMKVTLRQVADAYFDRPGQPLRDSTKAEMNRHIDKVFAKWADKPIASITIDDCRQRHREMCESGIDGRPAPGQAQISLVTLRTLINFANRRYPRADGSPLIPVNPVKAMAHDNWKAFEPRTRHIELHHVGQAWYALDEMRTAPKNTDALAAIDLVRFLLLTGARRTEGAALTWDHVFPSRSKVGHVTDARAPFETLRKALGIDGLSAHDLRRTYVTVGFSACDVELFKMELLTNHVPEGVTARHYLQTSRLQYLHRETQRISDHIEREGLVAREKATGGNVVALKRA